MTRHPRIALGLLLLVGTGFGGGLWQHDDVHPDGAAIERRIDPAAEHADEAGHVERSGGSRLAPCLACLLRLQSSAEATRARPLVGQLLPHPAPPLPSTTTPLDRLDRSVASRAPPLA